MEGVGLRSGRFAVAILLGLAAAAWTPVSTFGANSPSCSATPLFTGYLNWFDNASPGMATNNIHILNTGTAASLGCVIVGGGPGALSVSWTAGAGQETYVTMPAGTIGGPVRVTVNSGPQVRASQRIRFYSSFNELWAASASQAATTSYFSWYDKASAGMLNDNIHLLNPGTASASVTVNVSVPGATSQTVNVAPGMEAWVTFPQGTIGGPVTVSSTQPVLASQRVQYKQSFNEVWASSAARAATKSYFSWFDSTSAGVASDYIHLLNPGTGVAKVQVQINGSIVEATVNPGQETYVTFGPGSLWIRPINCQPAFGCPVPMGGPVNVISDNPVLASQRVLFYSSFNEIWSASASQATTTSYFNWYDRASPGMQSDNVHVVNLGTTIATVTVSVPGASPQTTTVSDEKYFSFPGAIGGPVTVSSTQPMLAAQRVLYYQTFNEIWAG
jgi:hypothetical protein